MLRPTTLVWTSIALTLPVVHWQALSAESIQRIQVPIDRMDSESSSLLVVGGILFGASCVASRMLRKPSLQKGQQTSGSPHGAVRTPSI